jgi:enterochelin esterase family protein
VNAFFERARVEGTPLIDGERVTFVWQGKQAPDLIADFSDWEAAPISLEKSGRNVWIYSRQFPRNAYLEYAFQYPQSGERPRDPFNPRTVSNGLGKSNHFFYMPSAAPTELIRRRSEIPHGQVTRHMVPTHELAAGARRAVYLYQPPTGAPSPLVVVFDGLDYLRRGKLPQIVDNLIAQERIRPVALAMVANGGEARTIEYACSEATLGFLGYSVLPLARQELNLLDPGDAPGAFGVLGASLGGLMALYAGLRIPDVFGHILSQSGAFRTDEHEFVVLDLIRYGPCLPVKIWMEVGKYEGLLSTNQDAHALLLERGYQTSYREYPGGHNYTSWRDELWRGLEHLFPPSEA